MVIIVKTIPIEALIKTHSGRRLRGCRQQFLKTNTCNIHREYMCTFVIRYSFIELIVVFIFYRLCVYASTSTPELTQERNFGYIQ